MIIRIASRNGHTSSERNAATIVVNATRNDESRAKPAPGPTYASTLDAVANRKRAAARARDANGWDQELVLLWAGGQSRYPVQVP